MALNHATVTVTTTANKVITLPTGAGKVSVWFQNTDGTNDLYIGGKGVTTSGATQGLKVLKGTVIELTLDGGDVVYGIAGGGTPSLSILWTRN